MLLTLVMLGVVTESTVVSEYTVVTLVTVDPTAVMGLLSFMELVLLVISAPTFLAVILLHLAPALSTALAVLSALAVCFRIVDFENHKSEWK